MRRSGGLELSARVLLSLGLLSCLYLVATRAVAEWYFRQPGVEGLRRAILWDAWNPTYPAMLARALERSTESTELSEVISLYEKAAQLAPYQARTWAELGGAYEVVGRSADAQRAYERAQQLFPQSAQINWRLGNFYLRQDRTADALKAFRKVLLGDPSLRRQVFDLTWRAGAEPSHILEGMIPHEPTILFQYLNYLLENKRLNEAGQVWRQLADLNLPVDPKTAFPYLDALLWAGRTDEVRATWALLQERNPTLIPHRPFDPNLMTNGDFESVILNGGLGWRVQPVEGVVVRVDSLTFFDGTHSLEIRFDGTHNVNYHHVSQLVPVKPNTLYQFTGYMRVREITTDSGPRFQLYDAFDPSRLYLCTENLVGSSSWSPHQLEFRTERETRLLVIRVARPASRKLNSRVAGTLWIDRVSLHIAESLKSTTTAP